MQKEGFRQPRTKHFKIPRNSEELALLAEFLGIHILLIALLSLNKPKFDNAQILDPTPLPAPIEKPGPAKSEADWTP